MISSTLTWIESLNANDGAIFATWVGTIFSLLAMLGVWSLRARNLAKVRLPILLKELRSEAKELNNCLIDASQFHVQTARFYERIVATRSTLQSISCKSVPKELKKEIKVLAKTIGKTKLLSWTHDSAFQVYCSVRSIEKLLDHSIKDLEA
ncbi:hypothetical protein [Prosthecobacter sp.]|uniref:hypothetical protein n=1 Tax=Prosthecobacter sp. TaxID=1965333 RepID=UPI00248A2CC0|nr:hypothetical protein [Prosthecobacter sp.]MDI1313231.1 hypothetical protein [Prosthecobacter sp.]